MYWAASNECTVAADGDAMSGIEIEHVLSLIDESISSNKAEVRRDILNYLQTHGNELAHEIVEKGHGYIPTRLGQIRISQKDIESVLV